MFTLITGTPRTGKSAYTVWEIIRPVIGTTVTDVEGVVHHRRVLSNIDGLTLPHEKIGAAELQTWHTWCKPGDVIVFDEVQEVWRPRTLGTSVPPAVAAIETHGHLGVDIVVITQHPGLVDSNVRKLVNQHIHLRRLTDSYCYRYEWDSCSDNVKATKSCVHSGVWRRPSAVHDLYRSAAAHTKTKSRLPALAYLLPVVIVALLGGGSLAYSRITSRFEAPKAQAAPVEPLIVQDPAPAGSDPVSPALPLDSVPLQPAQAQARGVGCIVMRDRCGCFSDGEPVEPDVGLCAGLMDGTGPALSLIPEPPSRAVAAHDGSVIAWMRAR